MYASYLQQKISFFAPHAVDHVYPLIVNTIRAW